MEVISAWNTTIHKRWQPVGCLHSLGVLLFSSHISASQSLSSSNIKHWRTQTDINRVKCQCCLRFDVQMFAQFLYHLLRSSVMKMQCWERRPTFQYEDQVRPAERRPRPSKRLQIFYVKIDDVFSGLRRRGATRFTERHICTGNTHHHHNTVIHQRFSRQRRRWRNFSLPKLF